MPAPRVNAVSPGNSRMEMLKRQSGSPPQVAQGERDEFGRLIAFTGTGFQEAGDIITYAKGSGAFNQAGSIISYGKSSIPAKEPLPETSAKKYNFGMNEATLPGDLLMRKSGIPVKKRMAALIRQRSIDMATLMADFLKRPGFSRQPQRGHAFADIPTFRRCLCYAFGEQWSSLGMTTPEFLETYSPYIVREQTESGDALLSWKARARSPTAPTAPAPHARGYAFFGSAALYQIIRNGSGTASPPPPPRRPSLSSIPQPQAFCRDIMLAAGVDKGDLGYLKEEVDLEHRASMAMDRRCVISPHLAPSRHISPAHFPLGCPPQALSHTRPDGHGAQQRPR